MKIESIKTMSERNLRMIVRYSLWHCIHAGWRSPDATQFLIAQMMVVWSKDTIQHYATLRSNKKHCGRIQSVFC